MRILLVEDERRMASIVSRALKENAYEVDLADTGERAIELARRNSYDSILLDVRLPGVTGVQVCRHLRTAGIHTPILMVTARTLVEQRIEGLDAGADDYLTKPFAIAELLARLRALLRRRLTDGRMLKYADLKLDRNHRRADRANQSIPLTPKEFLLLELLMMRAPNVVGREEILEHVWQMHFDPQTNLVEVHINRLRQKLSESGEMKIIHTVHGVGYCLRKTE